MVKNGAMKLTVVLCPGTPLGRGGISDFETLDMGRLGHICFLEVGLGN
jgi:hypothetical protein